ncbi:MAG: hypothetical protein AAF512_23255 [Pseudomonadota bacterium]
MKIRLFNTVFAGALALALTVASPVQARDRSGAVDKCGDAMGKLATQEKTVTKLFKDMTTAQDKYNDLVVTAFGSGGDGNDEEVSDEEKAADDYYEATLEPAIKAWDAAEKKAAKLRKSVKKLCSGKEIDIVI